METRSHHHTTQLPPRGHVTNNEHAPAPAGPGTWMAAVLVSLAAGAAPLIGFWTFAH
ncbi:hypothetical protein [Kitasatospora sp. NPDC093806]|uniref:hypothetical protein n=1 Tax=Kitasatospora sp. NPDC093806 TaxID=3155075 RepID=UPI003442F022